MPDGALSPVATTIAELHRTASSTVVVGITGGVAAGKTTTATELARSLSHTHGLATAVVSSDGFLFPNRRLAASGILERKGFPESYDVEAVHRFLDDVHDGNATTVPVYDHHSYDIVDGTTLVEPVDVLVFEGVNVLHFADRLDLAIYLHAEETHLQEWFTLRAFGFRDAARTTHSPFFDRWVDASDDDFRSMTEIAWQLVNGPNLVEHIEPTRANADIVIVKGADHTITMIESRSPGGGHGGRG